MFELKDGMLVVFTQPLQSGVVDNEEMLTMVIIVLIAVEVVAVFMGYCLNQISFKGARISRPFFIGLF